MHSPRIAQVENKITRLYTRQQYLQQRREQLQQSIQQEARAPKADWQGSFEWDTRALQVLDSTFHLQAFRPLQREVINATMQGRDVLCLMPSGGGKVPTGNLQADSNANPRLGACVSRTVLVCN